MRRRDTRPLDPAILVAAFLLDVAFHFVRLDFLAFRGDEAVSQAVPLGIRYEPDRSFRSDRTSGDIASIANLPEYRVFRPQSSRPTASASATRPRRLTAAVGPAPRLLLHRRDRQQRRADPGPATRVDLRLLGLQRGRVGPRHRRYAPLIRRLGMKHGLVLMEVLERDAWDRPIAMESRKPRFPYSAWSGGITTRRPGPA